MLNKYKIITLFLLLLLALPSISQNSRQGANQVRSNKRVAKPKAQITHGSACTDVHCKKKECIERRAMEEKTIISNPYLPKAGNYSIGIGAMPVLDFIGNMFNGNLNNSMGQVGGEVLNPNSTTTGFPEVSLMLKYFITDNIAIRSNLGFIMSVENQAEYVRDDAAAISNPLTQAKLTDYRKIRSNGGSISVGLEYRVGKGKIQGVFSGSVLYSFLFRSEEYSYGNAITELNQIPTVSSLSPITAAIPGIDNPRTLKQFALGAYNTAGLVGGVGFEWFIAPKISFGAEVNLSLLYAWAPYRCAELEGYNNLSAKVENYTELISPSSTKLLFGTQNIGGNLSLNFYF